MALAKLAVWHDEITGLIELVNSRLERSRSHDTKLVSTFSKTRNKF